jgi:ribosomal protein S18 acetylase RimI-like enzyme
MLGLVDVDARAAAATGSPLSQRRFQTTGRSMWPLLRPGDVARIEPLSRPPRPGDVLVYVNDRAELVAHRLIETLPDGRLRMRGDFAFTAEPPIERRRMMGRLTSVERAGRTLTLDGPLGRLLAFGVPVLERTAPALLAGLRHSAIRGVRVADGLWTAGPVRRLRRQGIRPGGFRVEIARPEQREAVLGHLRCSGRGTADLEAWAEPQRGPVIVLARQARGDDIVGFARARPTGTAAIEWRFEDIHVRHRWRGLGIGSAMAVTVIRTLHEASAPASSRVLVVAKTERARRLFWSLGFEPERKNQREQETNETVLCLPLPLPPTRLAHIVAALCRTPSHG